MKFKDIQEGTIFTDPSSTLGDYGPFQKKDDTIVRNLENGQDEDWSECLDIEVVIIGGNVYNNYGVM